MNLQSKSTKQTSEASSPELKESEIQNQNSLTSASVQAKPNSIINTIINIELWSAPRTVVLERLSNTSLGISIVGGKLIELTSIAYNLFSFYFFFLKVLIFVKKKNHKQKLNEKKCQK